MRIARIVVAVAASVVMLVTAGATAAADPPGMTHNSIVPQMTHN
jgi:hypothetical protein